MPNIQGLDRLFKKLDRVAATNVLVPPMNRAVLRVQRAMQEYPPQPANSKYRRTGTLGRRWTARVLRSGNGVTGKVGNVTSYGPFVQSERFQRRAFRGRWQTDARVVREQLPHIQADFRAAVDKALGE